jgi:hypothetical protein
MKKKSNHEKIEKVNGALVLLIDVVLIPPVQIEEEKNFTQKKKEKKF